MDVRWTFDTDSIATMTLTQFHNLFRLPLTNY